MSSQLQVTGEAKIRDIQGPVVANSGVITALDGAASQYVRGDGTLADFPTSSGGGSSVSYYLNSSVSQGTIGGVAYRELSKDPIIGAGTDIAISSNGYVANYITDVNDPDVTIVPGGNFNCEFYFSVNNNTGNPTTYAELYKYDGTTFTLLGTSSGVPESINQGTIIAPYYFAIPVATASLALTDRLAIRIYVNVDGRTVTLHTENGHLCQVVTTLSKGMVSLNNLTDQSQFLTTGTAGTNFAIVSSGDTHTFNLPVASATNTGKLSSTDWSTFNNKVPYTGATASLDLGSNSLLAQAVTTNLISTYTLEAKVLSNNSGSIILRTGTIAYNYGFNAVTLVSSPTSANTLSIISDVATVSKIAEISLGSLTATRTYTLPDASGTLALTSNLSSYVPYTGATADVDLGVNSYIGQNLFIKSAVNNIPWVTNYLKLGYIKQSTTLTFTLGVDTGNVHSLIFTSGNSYAYTFPNTNGTIALTSDLSAYVTLATTQTISGAKTFSSSPIIDNGTSGIPLRFKQYASTNFGLAGYTDIIPVGATLIAFAFGQTGADTKIAYFSAASLTNNVPQEYTLPNATGTIALLSGTQTFTGATTFGSSVSINTGGQASLSILSSSGNSALILGYVNSVLKGTIDISATEFKLISAIDNILKFQSSTNFRASLIFSSTADYSYTFPNTTGTIALTSQLPTYGNITSADSNTMTISGGTGAIIGAGVVLTLLNASATNGGIVSGGTQTFGGAKTFASSVTASNFISSSTGNANVFNSASATTGWVQIAMNNTSGSAILAIESSVAGTTTNGSLAYATILRNYTATDLQFATNNIVRATITSGGNVGIGTTSPAFAVGGGLQVKGSSFTSVRVTGGSFTGLDVSQTSSTGDSYVYLRDNAALIFGTNNTERMRITSGGNVLIGTTSDNGGKFQVVGRIGTSLSSSGANLNNSTLYLNNTANTKGAIFGYNDSADNFYFTSLEYGVQYKPILFNTSGATFSNLSGTGSRAVLADANGLLSAPVSDISVKQNISTIGYGLNEILKMNPVWFDFIDEYKNYGEGRQNGNIAQEMQEIIPEAVFVTPSTSKMGINYDQMHAVYIKAIQELKAEIDELKNK